MFLDLIKRGDEMLDEVMLNLKREGQKKPASEIGKIISLTPHFVFSINGQKYSSEHFTVYVPAVDRIKQYEEILGDDLETDIPYSQQITVDIGDLELTPDLYEMKFRVGDLIDVSDRGDTFIVHGRLVKWGETKELYKPTHRGED